MDSAVEDAAAEDGAADAEEDDEDEDEGVDDSEVLESLGSDIEDEASEDAEDFDDWTEKQKRHSSAQDSFKELIRTQSYRPVSDNADEKTNFCTGSSIDNT